MRRADKQEIFSHVIRSQLLGFKALFATSGHYMSSQCKLFNRLSELHTLLINKEKACHSGSLSEACCQTMHDEQVALTREIYDIKTDLLKSIHAVEELRAKTKSRLLVIISVSIALNGHTETNFASRLNGKPKNKNIICTNKPEAFVRRKFQTQRFEHRKHKETNKSTPN